MASTASTWNLNGTYTIPFTCTAGCPAGPYPYSVTITATTLSTGAVTGTGYYITGLGYPAVTVTGQVTGSNVSLTLLYTDLSLSSYNPFLLTGTIDALGGMSGMAIDGAGRTFTWLTSTGAATFVTANTHAKSDLVLTGTTGPAVGAVIFNSSAGSPNNLEMTVQLKKVTPNTIYDVYLFLGGFTSGTGTVVGTLTTNGVGNGTFHVNWTVAPGIHTVAVDVTLHGSGNDVYVTPGLYAQNLFLFFQ